MSANAMPIKFSSTEGVSVASEVVSDTFTNAVRGLFAIQGVFTGASIDAYAWIESSIDGSNWSKDHHSMVHCQTGADSATDSWIWELGDRAAPLMRVRWVPTAGTGTLNLYANTKRYT